jgi:hypothetical protein
MQLKELKVMNYFKNALFFIFISIVLNGIAILLKSDFLGAYLTNNIITILITLLAINIATSSIIIIKLQEITGNKHLFFKLTYRELSKSLVEQIVLIVISIVLLMLRDSETLNTHVYYFIEIIDTLLLAIFINEIQILFDTGKTVFIIVNGEQDES